MNAREEGGLNNVLKSSFINFIKHAGHLATMSDKGSTSELRKHIREEGIKIPEEIASRNGLLIFRHLSVPFMFLLVSILLLRFTQWPWYAMVPSQFALMLASQRAFQTNVHDLSHGLVSLTRRKKNDLFGNFFAAGWIGSTVNSYRKIHMQHHRHNGSEEDPEFISSESVRNKGGLSRYMLRYALGLESVRLLKKYYQGDASESLSKSIITKIKKMWHVPVVHSALLSTYFLSTQPLYYLLYLYIMASWSPMVSGLRFMVEHPSKSDLTMTTTSWLLEKTYFAPFNFNFHFEHHIWPSIPPYKLKRMHKVLQEKGFYERHPEIINSTYLGSLKKGFF